MSETSYVLDSIEVYLNLVNAASQLFSAPRASAPALCWHSSNPLLGGDCIPVYCAQAISEGELKPRGSICDRRCGQYGHLTGARHRRRCNTGFFPRRSSFTLWSVLTSKATPGLEGGCLLTEDSQAAHPQPRTLRMWDEDGQEWSRRWNPRLIGPPRIFPRFLNLCVALCALLCLASEQLRANGHRPPCFQCFACSTVNRLSWTKKKKQSYMFVIRYWLPYNTRWGCVAEL